MVGLRVAVFLSVLAIGTACLVPIGKPKTCGCDKKGPIDKPHGGGKPKVGLILGAILKPKHDGDRHDSGLFGALEILVGSLGDVVKGGKSIISELLHLKIPAALDDILNLVIGLGRALGLIVDVLIPGLGELLGNLIISVVKILFCILGFSSLGGDKRPGANNPAICGPEYGCKWGWKRYPGKYKDHRDLLKHYGVSDAEVQLELIIKKFTKGGGYNKLEYVHRVLYDHVLILIRLSIRSYSSWCKDDFISIYISISTILGVLGNSCKPGLGIKLVDGFEGYCSKHFKDHGYKDVTVHNSEIKKKLEGVKCWGWKGAINSSSDSQSQSETNESSSEDRRRKSTSEQSSEETEESKKQSQTTKTNKSDESSSRSDSQKEKTTSNSSHNSQVSQNRNDNSSSENSDSDASKRRGIKTTEESNKQSQTKKTNKSDESSSRSDSQKEKTTSNSSDNSQVSQNSNDNSSSENSDSDASKRRGIKTTEAISGYEKYGAENTKKEQQSSASEGLEKTKIDGTDGSVTNVKYLSTQNSSGKEEKSSVNAERKISAIKTVEEN